MPIPLWLAATLGATGVILARTTSTPVGRDDDHEEELGRWTALDGSPLYLSIRGRVYDVTAGAKFYGEGDYIPTGSGRDASRSFGTAAGAGSTGLAWIALSESLEGLTAAARPPNRWGNRTTT
ncbi:hypothetical protein ACHAW5_005904 [Stephanodiscus triporus]|uniref:Cytochrome b5 heme-binding domain-containing protein n=1 Tax=Stephanodiscus triporus TaxID=2934178 RepID=A0ABD3NIJ4_9STRA